MDDQDFKTLLVCSRVASLARSSWVRVEASNPPPVTILNKSLIEGSFCSEVKVSDLVELPEDQADYTGTILLVLRTCVQDEVPFHASMDVTMVDVFKTMVKLFKDFAPRPIVRRQMILPVIDQCIKDIDEMAAAAAGINEDRKLLLQAVLKRSRRGDEMRARAKGWKAAKTDIDPEALKLLATVPENIRQVLLVEDE